MGPIWISTDSVPLIWMGLWFAGLRLLAFGCILTCWFSLTWLQSFSLRRDTVTPLSQTDCTCLFNTEISTYRLRWSTTESRSWVSGLLLVSPTCWPWDVDSSIFKYFLLCGIGVAVFVVILRVLVSIRVLLPIVPILLWCSAFARHMSQSSSVKTGLTGPGLVTSSVTLTTWMLVVGLFYFFFVAGSVDCDWCCKCFLWVATAVLSIVLTINVIIVIVWISVCLVLVCICTSSI